MMAARVALHSVLMLLMAVTALGAQPQCNISGVDTRSIYGATPSHSFFTPSQTACCTACNASCAAWYHYKTSSDKSECKLFSSADVSKIQTGNCSAWKSHPTTCSSGVRPPPPTPVSPPSPSPTPPSGDVKILIDSRESKHRISHYLSSLSIVYAWAPDALYNHTLATWAKTNRVAIARFPAGMASYWNWENPTGQMGNSSLNPLWNGKPSPVSSWMSLEEYLTFCNETNMRPLVGVNYNCHGNNWVPKNESIARAVRQVHFVVSRGFRGAFYYIGNEDGAPNHAELIRDHAIAMKAVDPTMKVFWNDNGLHAESLTAFLNTTGDVMDGAEFHGKWPRGGVPKGPPPNVTDWLAEYPLLDHKQGKTWRDKIASLRAAAAAAGRPELLLANNEYGLGKPSAFGAGFDRYTKGLVVTEFALEMYVGGYDIAAFWDTSDGGNADHSDHMLTDTSNAYRMNPMHWGLELLGRSTNATMVNMSVAGGSKIQRVQGFAAVGAGADADASTGGTAGGGDSSASVLRCYLLSKNTVGRTAQLEFALPPSVELRNARAESMVDTADHWGEVASTLLNCSGSSCKVQLPPVSFTLLTWELSPTLN